MSENRRISDIVNGLKKGDNKSFKLIYELHERKLFAFIMGYTKNDAQTKDIIQETFIRLWNKRETLDPENSIKSYLFKTAYNIYIDKLRKKESELKMLDGWKYKRILDTIDEDEETRRIRIEKVRIAIDNLPKRCKEIFLLCKYEGFKYEEISEILDISTKTVQAQMVKAYKSIREDIMGSNIFLFFTSYLNKDIFRLLPHRL